MKRLDVTRSSLNTATLGYRQSIEKTIDDVARAGFSYIAPWRKELDHCSDLLALSKKIKDAGLNVSSLCRSDYLPAPSKELRLLNIQKNINALNQAAVLQAKCFVMVVGGLSEGSKNLQEAREQTIDGLGLLIEHARNIGVPLALEPFHPMYAADRSNVNTLEQALEICRLFKSDKNWIGIALDVYHTWWDPKLFDMIRVCGEEGLLMSLHVCDWLLETKDLLLDRGMMGDGVIEIANIRNAMDICGYNGPVEVEIFSQNNWWKRPIKEVLDVSLERLLSHC